MVRPLNFVYAACAVMMFSCAGMIQAASEQTPKTVSVDNGDSKGVDSGVNKDSGDKGIDASEGDVVEAPLYSKLEPIIGWNRHSGDSARTLKQWGRWVSYLRMKKPVIMNWVDGLKLRIYPGNEVFRSLYVRGMYDPNLNVVVNALLPKDGVFIDAGANMGYFSLLACKKVGSDGRIYAIEPSTRDFIRLVDNVNLNKLHEIISCHKLAFSNKNGTAEITIACEERSALNTFAAEFGSKGVEKLGKEKVEIITIDDFVKRERIYNVDVLKLDIEGSEIAALSGAKDTIEKFRPALMIGIKKTLLEDFNGKDALIRLSDMLKSMRYVAYRLVQDSEKYCLEKIDDITNTTATVAFCLHESVVPPELPQPERKNWWLTVQSNVVDFFTK